LRTLGDGVVETINQHVALRQTIDQSAAEADVTHCPLEFIGGGLRRSHRQMGEASETFGVRRNRLAQYVIVVAGKRDPVGAF